MADNITVTPGTGATIAADEISGVKHQRIKITLGADGVNDGDVSSSNPIPVSGSVTVSSAPVTHVIIDSGNPTAIQANAGTNLNTSALALETGGNLAAAKADLDTIAGAVSSSKVNVNISSGNPTSMAVTNTGTFAVQNTDALNAASGLTIKAAFTASQTGGTVLTPTSGKKVVITDIIISATGAGTVYLFDNTDSSTTCIGPTLSLAANGGATINLKKPFVSSAANNVIKYTSGSGAAGSIWIQYYEV